jgi:hypothetical protein
MSKDFKNKITFTQETITVRCVLDISDLYNDGQIHYQEIKDHIQPGYDWNRTWQDDYGKPLKKKNIDPILEKFIEEFNKQYPVGTIPKVK